MHSKYATAVLIGRRLFNRTPGASYAEIGSSAAILRPDTAAFGKLTSFA